MRVRPGCSHLCRRGGALAAVLTLVLVFLVGVAGAAPATADPAGSPGGLDLGCNNDDAPIPAAPGGAGGFAARPGDAVPDADPFENPGAVSLESVYGPVPQWWTYDNGCTGQFVAAAGTSLANIEMEVAGLLPSWSHALLRTVVDPDSPVKALNEPVDDATRAVSEGVWAPWLPIVTLLVALLVLLRARHGNTAGAVTATAWALGVLTLSSWVIQYPMESVELVDSGVSKITTLIATGFDDNDTIPRTGAEAIDTRMDDIIRSTQHRTWLAGAFGDPDSTTAREHGTELYRATHFSWDEWDTYQDNPDGEGKAIVEAKQDSFKQIAEEVKHSDPKAYVYFTGGKWNQRATAATVNLVVLVVVCGYLLIAGLASLLALALIRLIVPFAPVMGVLFMIDRTRDAAVGMLKQVVGPLVMGPAYFLAALLLLRLDTAILESSAWFPIKLGLIAVLAVTAWRLTRPAAYGLPGSGRLGRMLAHSLGIAAGARRGADVEDINDHQRAVPAASSPPSYETSPGGVYMYMPAMAARTPEPTRPPLLPGDFVPYRPPEALGGAARGLPPGPDIRDRGLREEFDHLPKDKRDKWVPLPGYPQRGTTLEKAQFYAEQLNREDIRLPDWQRNVVGGRWFNFAVAHEYRAIEVAINKYVDVTDEITGEKRKVKETNYFLDGLGFDGEVGSNKFCQIAEIRPETWKRYVNEFKTKYDTGRPDLLVADTAGSRAAVQRGELYPNEINRYLNGDKVMRVPRQESGIPEWARKYAAQHDVSIEETDTHPDAGVIR